MNVLYIIGGKGLRYGAEVIALNIIEHLTKDYGIHFTVVINSVGVISELCEKLAISYFVVRFRPYVYAKHKNLLIDFVKRAFLWLRAYFDDIVALNKLKKLIDFSSIDIIHTNLSRNMLGARIANKYKIHHIWHIQEMFDSHYRLKFLTNNQITYMNKNTDVFVCVSETVARDWIMHGLSAKKCRTILNGVNECDERYLATRKVYKLVMVSEITPPKGQEFVIDALSSLSTQERMKFTLDFIGCGKDTYVKKLKDKVRKNGLDSRIRFLDYIDNASDILKNYDILINASDGEGFGLSTAEAMMNSVCPLVSDCGANKELVNNNVTGVVYKKAEGGGHKLYRLTSIFVK